MNWLAIVGAVLKLITMILQNKFEKDARKRRKKEAYLVKAKEGIKNKDRSTVTAYFDAARRL
jgi:hypothetical protein